MTTVNANGTVNVTAILFSDPVPWVADFWEPHPWVSLEPGIAAIDPEAPSSSKPFAELEVPLDATLGDVLIAASKAWGIRRGPSGGLPGADRPLYADAYWISFADDRAETEFDRWTSWVHTLPIALPDGTIKQVEWSAATYRQLLVSSELGVLDADVTRPYIRLTTPQGDVNLVIEGVKATAVAIRAAYDALPAATHAVSEGIRVIRATVPSVNRVTDEAVRVGFWLGVIRYLRHRGRGDSDSKK